MSRVVFVGAGPGDPDLITVKGRHLLSTADCVIYAGSLVNPRLLEAVRPGIPCYDSSRLSLEETSSIMIRAVGQNQLVVRLHSGDPSVYGAIDEQIRLLRKQDIPFEIVPGVSSVTASAARLQVEFTPAGKSQTLIVTRRAGKTPVPASERLDLLARHHSSMAILLSSAMIEEVSQELLIEYPPDTPAALVYHVSWPDERIILTTVADLAREGIQAGITSSALILVGDFLMGGETRSYLYGGWIDAQRHHLFPNRE